MLKYGQDNFSVLIIEYTGVENLVTRETHFITTVLPCYNVLKQGFSSLGYRQTEATKKTVWISSKESTFIQNKSLSFHSYNRW